ncbi:MAG: helix-turn-helix domain-containing protein [Candidatus Methanoperedens sp.]|nr:helix-turn-helix domain-containing protein [Candidatus Methanoperedens sp.]
MFVQLPFNLTPTELAVLKKTYEEGCFTPGPSSCKKPKTRRLKDVAKDMGVSPQAFSLALANARRKVMQAAGQQIFRRGEAGVHSR